MYTERAFISTVVVLSFGSLCCQPGGPATFADADRAAIEKVTDDALALANAADKDWAAYTRTYYAPDAVVMPPNTTSVKGHEAIASFFESFPPLSEVKFEQIEVDGAGGLAYVWATYSLKMSPADADTPTSDSGKYIEIWRKQADGSWRVALDIFNSDLPIPEAEVHQPEES